MFIVPSQMSHHAEAEACDLVMEVEQLDQLIQEKILHFLTCAKGDNGIVITKLNFKSGRGELCQVFITESKFIRNNG